jgi:hypothetical protein
MSQAQVSRYLKKLIELGFLVPIDTSFSIDRKAITYVAGARLKNLCEILGVFTNKNNSNMLPTSFVKGRNNSLLQVVSLNFRYLEDATKYIHTMKGFENRFEKELSCWFKYKKGYFSESSSFRWLT